MKKKILAMFIMISIIFCFVGCNKKEITLNLSYGERTGTYTGDLTDGIPNGQGKFTTENDKGEKWTYEGEFKNGHFEGEGKTTWKSGQIEIGTYKDDVIVPLKGSEINSLYTNPKELKNHCVEIVGRVFIEPEYQDGIAGLQIWADPEKSEKNTIIYVNSENLDVKEGDYVKVVGIVGEVLEGENSFGGSVSAPTVHAREFEKISYKDAVSPAIKTVDVNQTKTQYGYSVTVQKIEFAEKETRVYIKVENKGSDKFSLYSFYSVISQEGKQFKEQDNWDANYPKIDTDLLKGNYTEGVIAFPTLADKSFKLTLEGSSDNFDEEIKPFVFNIEV